MDWQEPQESELAEIEGDAPAADTSKKFGDFFKFVTVGDKLAGYLRGSRTGTNNFGQSETKYDIETKEGLRTITAGADLKAKLPKVPVGSFVEITFKSEAPPKDGHKYGFKEFQVRCAKPKAAPAAPF